MRDKFAASIAIFVVCCFGGVQVLDLESASKLIGGHTDGTGYCNCSDGIPPSCLDGLGQSCGVSYDPFLEGDKDHCHHTYADACDFPNEQCVKIENAKLETGRWDECEELVGNPS